MASQSQKAHQFCALHKQSKPFVMPNPWHAGSAKILTQMGFSALATTSAGFAFTEGQMDGRGQVSKAAVLKNALAIVESTPLPISADLENGYAHEPSGVYHTIQSAAEIGLVGASIEDATGHASSPIYDFDMAVERIQAAVEAKNQWPFPFMLTARSENFLQGRADLKDTIRRLQAFQEVGADVLFAPGLNQAELATLVREVDCPVSALCAQGDTVQALTQLGVQRISVGSSLARAAFGAFMQAAQGIADQGVFEYLDQCPGFDQFERYFEDVHTDHGEADESN